MANQEEEPRRGHAIVMLEPHRDVKWRRVSARELMTTHERRRLLCEMLGNVNAEWRELARDNGVQAKWTRMKELRSQRLAITAELFDLDVRDRLAS